MSRLRTLSPDETADALSGTGFFQEEDRLEAVFRTGDFSTGARLVSAIAEIADEVNHHPDLSLSYGQLSARLSSHDAGGVTERDLDLALRIAAAAAGLGISADAAL